MYMKKIVLIFCFLLGVLAANANFDPTPVSVTYVPSSLTSSSVLVEFSGGSPSAGSILISILDTADPFPLSSAKVYRINPSSTNYLITGLNPSTSYLVQSLNSDCPPSDSVLSILELAALPCTFSTSYDPGAPTFFTTPADAPPAAVLTLENNCPSFVGFNIQIDDSAPAPSIPGPTGVAIDEFIIKRSFDGVNFHEIATVGPGTRVYYDQGPAPGIKTHYVVYSRSASGAISVSNTLIVDVKSYQAPAPPQNLISTWNGKTDTQLHIIWENPIEDTQCGTNIRKSYYIKVKREWQTEYTTEEIWPTSTGYYIKDVNPNETVFYEVFSISDQGIFSSHVGGSDKAYGPASSPSAFIGVAYKDVLNNASIGLSWNYNKDDTDFFEIEVSEDSVNFKPLGKVKAVEVNEFKHEPLEEGVNYFYRIKAGNYLYGTSPWVKTSKISAPYSSIPNAPFGLTSKSVSGGVELKWYDDSNAESNYVLERSIDNKLNFAKVADLDRNTITYMDKTVTAGKTYFYQVKAINPLGSSKVSNISEIKVVTTSGVLNSELINLYPNPALNYITVSLPDGLQYENIDISILDQMNRPVLSKVFNTQSFEVNLSQLKPGLYNIVITSENFKTSKKVFKQF